jgi:drug/metabolite transporter (DMT)-like permease
LRHARTGAWVFLGERLSRVQTIGIVLALVSVILLAQERAVVGGTQ